MSAVRRAATGVWEFVVGDDWRLAAGAAVALGGAAGLVAAGLNAWWFAPLVIPAVLLVSVRGSGR